MNQIKFYTIGYLIILTVAVYFVIDRVRDHQQPDFIERKKLMQRADQVKRKGYEIEYRTDEVCGYYYWKDDLKWNTDSYCKGQYGIVESLPDSLNFFHRRMIDEVDRIAQRKGFGGW